MTTRITIDPRFETVRYTEDGSAVITFTNDIRVTIPADIIDAIRAQPEPSKMSLKPGHWIPTIGQIVTLPDGEQAIVTQVSPPFFGMVAVYISPYPQSKLGPVQQFTYSHSHPRRKQ